MFAMASNWLKGQFQGKDNYNGTAMVLVVGNKGYDYKNYTRGHRWRPTDGFNIHFALNGPLQLTYDEFDEFIENITTAVKQARAELDQHEAGN